MCTLLFCIVAVLRMDVPTVDELKQASDEATSQIRTARIVYHVQVVESSSEPPHVPFSDEQLSKSSIPREQYEESFQAFVLTRNLDELRTIQLDSPAMQWRVDIRDLRDIDSVMKKAGVPSRQRMNVDHTSTILAGKNAVAQFHPVGPSCSVHRVKEVSSILPWAPVYAGIIPRAFFDNPRATISVKQDSSEGVPVIRVTSASPSKRRSVMQIDPVLKSRYRVLEVYGEDGKLEERYVADDYRIVDGVSLPFASQTERWASDGSLRKAETFTVREAAFNIVLDPTVFRLSLPAGTSVSAFDKGRGRLVTIKEGSVMPVEEIAALAQQRPPATASAPAPVQPSSTRPDGGHGP